MCGIAGILQLNNTNQVNQSVLKVMNTLQSHRGPDDDGYHFEAGVGLAHRRLSIIDIAGSHQPLFNETGDVAVVFNGEIYNFAELTVELKALGHVFATHGDTETIVHAWEEWGVDCVQHFRGMFAFAIWDRTKQQLFLARDRMGIKPLFYSLLPSGELLFGSELKVLTAHPEFDKGLYYQGIEDYFTFGYIPEPHTIYANSYKLNPGHYLLIDKTRPATLKQTQYWDVDFSQAVLTEQQVKAELLDRLKEAVDIRLIAEVPLGAFLSGGVDSSAIVALMAQLQQDKAVNTCSIGFDDQQFDESDYASQVARQYQTNHRSGMVDRDDFSLIDKLAALYDEPYADSSAMPTYRVCQLARKHVTVALSGDGGDELFGGYRRYRYQLHEEKMRSIMPQAIRQPLFGMLGKVYPKLDWAPRFVRAKTTFQSLAMNAVSGYCNTMSIMRSDARAALFSPQLKQKLAGYQSVEVFKRHAANANTDDPLKLVQYLDMKTYLVGDILTKVDRASMAHSLEVRVPLLDHKYVEWASRLPSNMNISGNEGKAAFKQALEPHLPHDILYRKKMGFAVPLASWFRGPLKQTLQQALNSEALADSGLFNQNYIQQLYQQHVSGKRDHSSALWTLLMFSQFYRQQLGQ
ncbi:XrtA/PEP-CTERM system amidotransferase [Arsukibacterium sp.]|uniref:XrtA/PEP-CTERM system amidotransferase n=1 Tax=Arsukibacterium sp. TaxID=1977258 RepID=UPI001BD3592C|nr:XrtA/PEP-CTERM system amidotransferase [Arsukibacterium sp.]